MNSILTFCRFLYWRVCCYVCTREPKKKRLRRMETFRQQNRYSGRSNIAQHQGSFRRSMRISQRTNDSGVDNSFYDPNMMHAHSDTDLRYGIFFLLLNFLLYEIIFHIKLCT